MVILPTESAVGSKPTSRITFFIKIFDFLQQQAEETKRKAILDREEEEEARKAWEEEQAPLKALQEAVNRLKEQGRKALKKMEGTIPKKGIKLVPCFPLQDTEVIDVDETFLVTFSLKIRPAGANKSIYKKTVRRFSDGSPSVWLQTLQDINEIWTQNRVGGPNDRAATVRTILHDDALTIFVASIESQTEVVEGNAAAAQLTNEKVDNALKAVTASVFPHRALETQKLWMRRHMKKPAGMSYRLMQAKVLKMNRAYHYFQMPPMNPSSQMESC